MRIAPILTAFAAVMMGMLVPVSAAEPENSKSTFVEKVVEGTRLQWRDYAQKAGLDPDAWGVTRPFQANGQQGVMTLLVVDGLSEPVKKMLQVHEACHRSRVIAGLPTGGDEAEAACIAAEADHLSTLSPEWRQGRNTKDLKKVLGATGTEDEKYLKDFLKWYGWAQKWAKSNQRLEVSALR